MKIAATVAIPETNTIITTATGTTIVTIKVDPDSFLEDAGRIEGEEETGSEGEEEAGSEGKDAHIFLGIVT